MDLLLLLAVLPAVVLLIYIYKKDTYEKESPKLLIMLFILGVVSTIPAATVEGICEPILDNLLGDEKGALYHFINAFLIVALSEEGFKFLFCYLKTWKNKEFNYKFDAIVYSVYVSLGFATLENILYVIDNGLGIAISRAILSVPGHAFFAVFMGYYYGLAKEQDAWQNKKKAMQYNVLAIIVPVLLHGAFDFLLFMENVLLVLVFFVMVTIMDILAIRRINKSSRENHMIEEKIKCKSCSKLMNSKAFYCGYCGTPLRYKPYDYAQPVQETVAIENMSNMNMHSNSFINEMDNVYENNMNIDSNIYHNSYENNVSNNGIGNNMYSNGNYMNDEHGNNYTNNINNACNEYGNNYTNNINNVDNGYENNYINNTNNF